MHVLTIRGELKGVSRNQESNTCPIQLQPRPGPSNFFFGYIKGKPFDYNCERREDLVNAITAISTGVDQEVLLNIFESWVNGGDQTRGEVTHGVKKNKRHFFKLGRGNARMRTYRSPPYQCDLSKRRHGKVQTLALGNG
jgi:hypothetical protein